MGFISDYWAMYRVKRMTSATKIKIDTAEEDLRFCYDVLEDVSRSFTVVIQQLTDRDLRDGICLFYLVLRALDTVEDDMSVPVDVKLRELPKFHTHLQDLEWSMSGVGEGRERELLENFPRVTREYKKLKKEFQIVIDDITERMANGMCDFLQRPVITKDDYDLYCHYVAGLVGHGLVRLFAHCGYEDPHLADDLANANHMGLFLQKNNITRDYYEDIREEPPRMFWPKEIWGEYAAELKDLADPENKKNELGCLNAMVADALRHLPNVIDFLAPLRDPSVFRFCAIPQVMAIATLAEVYNNADTFQVKVKISKATTCHILLETTTFYNSLLIFEKYCDAIEEQLDEDDVKNTATIRETIVKVRETIDGYKAKRAPVPYSRSLMNSYPGLGGRLLLSVVDSVAGFFSTGSQRGQVVEDASAVEPVAAQ